MQLWQYTFIFAVLSACGCAHVEVRPIKRSAINDSAVTGVRCYMPQPYLLVKITKKDNVPEIVTELISLPDLEHPLVAEVKPGWGSVNGSITLNDKGILTALGATIDSKIPESLGAVSGLLTAAKAFIPTATAPAKTEIEVYLIRLDIKGGQIVPGPAVLVPVPH